MNTIIEFKSFSEYFIFPPSYFDPAAAAKCNCARCLSFMKGFGVWFFFFFLVESFSIYTRILKVWRFFSLNRFPGGVGEISAFCLQISTAGEDM